MRPIMNVEGLDSASAADESVQGVLLLEVVGLQAPTKAPSDGRSAAQAI